MARFLNSRGNPQSAHKVTPAQFTQGILAFLLFSLLIGVLLAGVFVPAVGALGATAKAVPAAFEDMPDDLVLVTPSEESRMVDSDGREIARFYSTRRIVVNSDQISDTMKQAQIAIEDRRFYKHHGIDPDGMVRAAVYTLSGNPTQGGSTITQQFVKNMLMEKGIQEGDQDLIDSAQAVSYDRKLKEMRYAMALESKMTKDEILTGYLNVAPYGPTVNGVEAAAHAYFSVSAKDLTIGQSALLAGIVQSPVKYDPLTHPEEAEKRRNTVLDVMLKQDFITQEEHDEAFDVSVDDMLNPENRREGCIGASDNMGYFCRYAVEEFLSDDTFGETRQDRQNLLDTGGLVIRTTINRDQQKAAFQAATDLVPIDDNEGKNTVDTALVSVENKTGYIVSMAQNTRFGPAMDDDLRSTEVSYNVYRNRGGGTGFQPGSTFKAFTLTEWFNEGHSAYETVGSSNTFYAGGSFSCGGAAYPTGPWDVRDLPGKGGTQSVMNTMVMSINQGIASMASKVDYCQIFQRAEDLGVVKEDGSPISPDNPAALIGTESVSPLVMASAFSAFANDGNLCAPQSITEVADRDGQTIKSNGPNCQNRLNSQVARQVSTVLQQVAKNYPISFGTDVGAKSGTTDDNSNTWMVGFSATYATAAWAGFANESSKGVQDMIVNGVWYSAIYGSDFVGPMWGQYSRAVSGMTGWQSLPNVFIGNKPVPKVVQQPSAQETEEPDTPEPEPDTNTDTNPPADPTSPPPNNG